MINSILEKLRLERSLIIIIIGAIVVVFGIFIFLLFGYSSKSLKILSPLGREEWEIGQTYEIKWKAHGIDRVGLVLFNADKPEWIAENLPASTGKYQWKIQPGHEYGANFWVAVIEYPWKKGNLVSYSSGSFSIVYPEMASCDSLAMESEWPFFASDTPNVRKVFITEETFRGNLEGLAGADEKCKTAAAEKGYSGSYIAFIGGDNPEETAVKRLEKTVQGLNGIFIDAVPSSTLIRDATCHRLIANNFTEFLKRFSDSEVLNKERLSSDFLNKMKEIWLGRINEQSLRNCTSIDAASQFYTPLAERYSYTVTCENWTEERNLVEGYSRGMVLDDTFASCYTPTGEFTYVAALSGLGTILKGEKDKGTFYNNIGHFCSEPMHLLCIEQ